MKKKQHHLTPAQINFNARMDARAFMVSGRAVKLIALIVLHEPTGFNFTMEQCREFLDKFEDTLDYYNNSKDYQALLTEWDDYFFEQLGEHILWKEGRDA